MTKDKLFAFILDEKNGEYEYNYDKLIVAKNINEATQKAEKYVSRFYPGESEFEDGGYYFFDRTIHVKVAIIVEITKERWTDLMYHKSLVFM